jgi:hypothetical protein
MRIPGPAVLLILLLRLAPCLLPWTVWAQPTIRVDKAYEDTVRILILSNDSARGNCNLTSGVGIKTRDFVLKSLTGVPNVKYRESKTTQWSDVQGIWPGKLPHVIVHVNAGWTTESGPYADGVLNTGADSGIGVVSIGDDAAALAEKTFGMLSVDNTPQPMGDATQYLDSTTRLWLDLDGKADTVGGGGIVRNTTDSLHLDRLFFYPVEPNSGADPSQSYRCQEDADKYSIDPAYANNVTFMGFQRAFDGKDTIAGPRELQTIIAFQNKLRRGVALSYQPQFLANPQAAHQIDYDAIMYSSGANLYRNPSLAFTDSLGRELGVGDVWSPARGKLYLTFMDDFVSAVLSKQITLTIVNGTGAAGDVEAVTAGSPEKTLGGKGRWRVEIALAEKPAAAADGIVEVTLPSVITATAPSHGETGLPDGGTVKAVLYLNSTLIPPPTLTLAAGPNPITAGSSSTLTWSSANATSCTAGGAWSGTKAVSGSQSSGTLTSTGTFTLACMGPGGSANRSVTITVTDPPRPPNIDTIQSAWMLDLNGNGAADQARFRFTRPLNVLPAAVSPIYWNDVGPRFTAKPPVLSFLAGSGQSIVVADFSGAEFPAGLTSIPAGARPQATFPSDTVFGGQTPPLADSMGAIPMSAVMALGASPAEAPGNAVIRIPDTLTVTVSEPLRPGSPSRFPFFRFGKWKDGHCLARGQSLPVAPLGAAQAGTDPLPSALSFIIVLDPLAANPVSGDCAYLEGDGSVLDLPGNVPAALGVRITGPKPPMGIRSAVGYPPVSGGGSANPDAIADLRWIPPVGFAPGDPFREPVLPAPGQPAIGADPNRAEALAPGTVLVKVVSAGKYVAHARLFDNLGNFVATFGQSFGYKGELDNAARLEPQGYRSFLVWDGRDAKGRLAGQGVLVWKIDFILDDGTRLTKSVRTGLLR